MYSPPAQSELHRHEHTKLCDWGGWGGLFWGKWVKETQPVILNMKYFSLFAHVLQAVVIVLLRLVSSERILLFTQSRLSTTRAHRPAQLLPYMDRSQVFVLYAASNRWIHATQKIFSSSRHKSSVFMKQQGVSPNAIPGGEACLLKNILSHGPVCIRTVHEWLTWDRINCILVQVGHRSKAQLIISTKSAD